MITKTEIEEKWKTQLACEFKPAWIEAESQPDEKLEFTK